MLQARKIRTPRELYFDCIDEDRRDMHIQRYNYTFSMEMRKEAAQATIEKYVKSMISSKPDKGNVYSDDSDSSSCGDQYAPSPTLLKNLINGLPYFEPLHFGFHLPNDVETPSCVCPCAQGLTCWRSNFSIDWEDEVSCKFRVFMPKGLLQHCETKSGSYHDCVLFYLGKLIFKSDQSWVDDLISYGNQRGDENEETFIHGNIDVRMVEYMVSFFFQINGIFLHA